LWSPNFWALPKIVTIADAYDQLRRVHAQTPGRIENRDQRGLHIAGRQIENEASAAYSRTAHQRFNDQVDVGSGNQLLSAVQDRKDQRYKYPEIDPGAGNQVVDGRRLALIIRQMRHRHLP
jgi:hypothetical protein